MISMIIQCPIKQFVVRNCSKERPGSIVNETLKNGILILKDTSKELDFYADFKYISFIKFSLKLDECNRIQRIREPLGKNFKLLPTKMWNFMFFTRRQITGACLFFFPQGSSCRPSGPRMSREGSL